MQVKSNKQGKANIIVNADDSESKLIGFEYYQTKSQKRQAQNKLESIATKKGSEKLTKLIQNKTLLRSQVTGGSGTVEDILQKLETGELEIDGAPVFVENGDGSVTVKMIIKPR